MTLKTSVLITIFCWNVGFSSVGQVINIDLNHAFETKQQINLSEIAHSVEYVKLETKPKYRCGPQVRVFCNEQYIITVSINNILLFDRKSGAFIANIGDTDQIYSTYYVMPFDEQRQTITFKSAPDIIKEYSVTNQFFQKIKLPVDHGNSIYWKDGKYIQFVANLTGNESRRLMVFKKNNTIIKLHLNKNKYEKSVKANFFSNREGGFYWFNHNLYFKETFIDTIYKVTEDKLIPKYCFNSGYRGLEYSIKGSLDIKNKQNYLFISNIFETQNYLFFDIEYGLRIYSGIFFKKDETCEISNACLTNRTGFENDIDHFIPLHFSSVNNSNELVGFCIPSEVKKWKEEHTAKISDKVKLHILEMQENDNPVVIIAKLK